MCNIDIKSQTAPSDKRNLPQNEKEILVGSEKRLRDLMIGMTDAQLAELKSFAEKLRRVANSALP